MNKKLLFYTIFISFTSFLLGCGSGQYNVSDLPEKEDTSQITRTTSTDTTEDEFWVPINSPHRTPVVYRVLTPPKITITGIGFINMGLGELASNYSNVFEAQQFTKGETFGVKYGTGFKAIGKFSLEEKGNIRLNVSAAYNFFKNDLFSGTSDQGSVKYNMFNFGVGIENNFAPIYKVRPYIAVEILASFISGEAVINDLNTNTSTNLKIKSSFRMGYAIYSGLEVLLSNNFGLNFGVQFTDANRLFKQSNTDGTSTEISLRDKEAPGLQYGGYKQFTYTSFFMGINWYYGVKNILYNF